MRLKVIALFAFNAIAATDAVGQVMPNLSGPYQCIQICASRGTSFVTHNGWDLNLVNEIGETSRAWIDWPGHFWAQNWNEGAIYSPDGMTIQFDRGTVWQRVPEPTLRRRY